MSKTQASIEETDEEITPEKASEWQAQVLARRRELFGKDHRKVVRVTRGEELRRPSKIVDPRDYFEIRCWREY